MLKLYEVIYAFNQPLRLQIGQGAIQNLVREPQQVVVLLWEFVLLVGVKALQAIGNYTEVALRGPYFIEAVTAHA